MSALSNTNTNMTTAVQGGMFAGAKLVLLHNQCTSRALELPFS